MQNIKYKVYIHNGFSGFYFETTAFIGTAKLRIEDMYFSDTKEKAIKRWKAFAEKNGTELWQIINA